MKRLVALAVTAALLGAAGSAPAQAPEKTADELFNDAMKLLEKRDFAGACPMLTTSQRLEPRVGTLLWLGYCLAGEGKPKAARARYLEAEAAAKATSDPRAKTAREEAAKLAEKVPKLLLGLPKTPGLGMLVDGQSVELPVAGVPLELEVGEHVLRFEAPERATYTKSVQFGEGETVELEVPDLKPRAGAGANGPRREAERELETGYFTTRRVVGLGLAGGGVLAAGVGAGLFFSAKGTLAELTDACGGQNCPRSKADEISSGKTRQVIGDVAMIAGGALFVAGAVVFVTAPSGARVTALAGPRAVAIDLRF